MDESPLPGRDALLALNRAATSARLMSGVIHDVNNALQVISGTVELLEARPDLPAPLQGPLQRIRSQSTRAATVMADAMVFTRGSIHDRGPVNLREVADHSIALRSFALRRSALTARVDAVPGRHFVVRGNRAQLQQAVLNLVMNAEQALAGGAGEIVIALSQGAGSIELRVLDNGPGIRLAPVEKALEPFVSTRDPWDGAGLGLWAARAIAAEHGGSVALEPRDTGTAVVVRLPPA